MLKSVEDFVRKGYVGTIAGVPIYVSAAVANQADKAEAFLAAKSAITCFMKKGVEVEQERDGNTRTNTAYSRKYYVVALTNEAKAVKISLTA